MILPTHLRSLSITDPAFLKICLQTNSSQTRVLTMSSLLSDYVFASRYANYIAEDKRRETWDEANDRVFGMHRRKFGHLDGVSQVLDQVEAAHRSKKILGSQRALQFGGQAVERINARISNCTAAFADRPRFFAESFWLLLCGCGVGFSVQKHHVAKLPVVKGTLNWAPELDHVIEDSIEGWADALDALVNSYLRGTFELQFDSSLVRPKGSWISTGVGKAPGPVPLLRALEDVRKILKGAVGRQLKPIEVYDIVMFASQAVLSGGVRRSATICIFSPDDVEMRDCKTGDWWQTNPQRARSNNSAVLLRNQTSREEFHSLFEAARQFGDPGFYWVDHLDTVPNPCLEIGMRPIDDGPGGSGLTGWQFCDLSLINGATCESEEDFYERAALASALGTFQAAYLDLGYLGPVSERIKAREALIGVSITGVQARPQFCLNPEVLRKGAAIVRIVNEEVAAMIGTNPAARLTCIKPEGSSSTVLDTPSGCHRAKGIPDADGKVRFIRRVQATADEAMARAFAEANPHAVERTRRVGDEQTDDLILSFAMELDGPGETQTAVEFLQDVKTLKENWVDAGKVVERCSRPDISNNVSNTCTVKDGEWDAVEEEIFRNQNVYCGVSLLGSFSDLAVAQAPFTSCQGDGDRSQIQAKWEELKSKSVRIEYASIHEEENGSFFVSDGACSGGACLI